MIPCVTRTNADARSARVRCRLYSGLKFRGREEGGGRRYSGGAHLCSGASLLRVTIGSVSLWRDTTQHELVDEKEHVDSASTCE